MGAGGGDVYRVIFGKGDGFRRTEVARRDSLFIVTFQIGDDSIKPSSQLWSYSVSLGGVVSLLERR